MPCIYLMIDGKLPGATTNGGDEGNEDSDEEEPGFTEIRFVPPENGTCTLEDLYSALSRGQSLHPDPNDMSDDSEGEQEEDDYETGEPRNCSNGNGNHNQFEDQDEMDE